MQYTSLFRVDQFSHQPNHTNPTGTKPVLFNTLPGHIAVQCARGALPIIRPISTPNNFEKPVYYLAANQQPSKNLFQGLIHL